MVQNHTTYARNAQPMDWSTEITPPPRHSGVRAASDTGLGGMEAEMGMPSQRGPVSGGGNAAAGGARTGTGGTTIGNPVSGDWLYAPGSGRGNAAAGGARTGTGGTTIGNSVSGDWLYAPGPGRGNSGMDVTGNSRIGSLIPAGVSSNGNENGQRQNGSSWPDIENNLPEEMIEAPTTMEEVYRGSMKALLARNIGNYVVATFLIGTQTTVSWEGILYDVGNDYVAIYQSGRDQYIVSDLYSLRYVEFYDTRRRELCDALLMQNEQQES